MGLGKLELADLIVLQRSSLSKKTAGNPDATAAHQPTESAPNSTSAKIIKL